MKHSGPIVGQSDDLRAVDCHACGFIHLLPIPDTYLYASGMYHSTVKPSMSAEYTRDLQWWNAVYSDWLRRASDLAPNKSLLDIGSGTGDFVRQARHLGWDAQGIEPDPILSKQDFILRGEFSDFGPRDFRGLGVVSAHWVMEHLEHPVQFLSWAKSILAPRGVLLLTVPNDFTPIQHRAMRAVNRDFYWIHREHINYWNKTSFVRLLKRSGFNVDLRGTYGSWQPERYLIAGVNYLDNSDLGSELHLQRIKQDLVDDAKRRWQAWVSGMMGRGRDLTFIAVKQ